jgi:uncharacterized paraquat-inducible protein A
MVVNPFFLLKIVRPKLQSAFISVKTGSPDLADFATTQASIQLAYHAVTAAMFQRSHNHCTNSRAAKNGPQTFGISCKKQEGECFQLAQWLCDHWHIVDISARHAKGLCPMCHSKPSRKKNPPNLENHAAFTMMDVLLYGLSL